MSYKHKRYDETIMQTKTVSNILKSLRDALKDDNIREVVNYLTKLRRQASSKGTKRKANSIENRIKRLADTYNTSE